MRGAVKVIVDGSLADDLGAFRSAWERAEKGEAVAPERVLAFQSWEALASVLTGERYRLLRHLHAHKEPSVSALARHLGRHLRRVQADVQALEAAGLVDRTQGDARITADRLQVTIERRDAREGGYSPMFDRPCTATCQRSLLATAAARA